MHDSVYFLWVGGFVSCQCRWRGSSTLFTLPDQQPQYRRTSSYRFSTFPFPTLHQHPLTINYTSLHLDRFPNSLSLTFIISCQCSVATNHQTVDPIKQPNQQTPTSCSSKHWFKLKLLWFCQIHGKKEHEKGLFAFVTSLPTEGILKTNKVHLTSKEFLSLRDLEVKPFK